MPLLKPNDETLGIGTIGANKSMGNVGPGIGKASPTYSNTLGFDPVNDLSRDNALPGQNYYDKNIDQDLINPQLSRDKNFFSDNLNYGVGDAGLASPFGESSDPMAQAAGQENKRQFDSDKQGEIARNENQATLMASHQTSVAAHEMGAKYQNEVQNFNAQYQYQLHRFNLIKQWHAAQAKAQAQMWGSVFGGLGSLAGSAIGGAIGSGGE